MPPSRGSRHAGNPGRTTTVQRAAAGRTRIRIRLLRGSVPFEIGFPKTSGWKLNIDRSAASRECRQNVRLPIRPGHLDVCCRTGACGGRICLHFLPVMLRALIFPCARERSRFVGEERVPVTASGLAIPGVVPQQAITTRPSRDASRTPSQSMLPRAMLMTKRPSSRALVACLNNTCLRHARKLGGTEVVPSVRTFT